jgi:hypothetical protein
MDISARTSALRILLATALIATATPAMSENFLDKLRKATDTIERGRESAKRTVNDVNELGSSGKNKKKKGSDGDAGQADGAGSSASTVKTTHAGEATQADGPSAELRQQVGRMGNACRERSAEGSAFTSCAETCGTAADRISSSTGASASEQAHASCQSSYNQAMGFAPVAETAPARVESGQSPMPGG